MGRAFERRLRAVAVLGLWVISTGCRERAEIVAVDRCDRPGDTQSCAGPNGCGGGTQVCTPERLWSECTGYAQLPANTQCSVPGLAGVCAEGSMACESGSQPFCRSKGIKPTAEVCDKKDNDCNGLTDDFESTDIKICSQPKPSNVVWGTYCVPGYELCVDGEVTCVGRVDRPAPRQCENGLDNDCNGVLDREESSGDPRTDIVLFIDESGSMASKYPAVRSAITQFAQGASSRGPVQIAIVGMPKETDGKCGVETNFVDPAAIPAVLTRIQTVVSAPGLSFGNEPTLDCPYMAALPSNPLALNYRAGVKKVFVSFSDEEAQSYLTNSTNPPGPVTAYETGRVLRAFGAPFWSFDSDTLVGARHTYDPVIQEAGGGHFDLDAPAARMRDELTQLLHTAVCR